jgi:hypothetical protein
MTSDLLDTVAIRQCNHCAAEMPASDNFCRRCGIRQEAATGAAAIHTHRTELDTKIMRRDAGDYQTLSSLLVNTLAQSVAVKTTPLHGNRLGTGVIATLVAIPIWLLIILLSPLDAYAAARAASSQMNCR